MSRELLIPLAVLVSGCQVGESQPGNSPAPAAASPRQGETGMTDRRSTGPRIATYRHEVPPGGVSSGAAARLEGILALVDNCLVVAGETPVQPVFREDSVRWEQSTQRLVFRGAEYRIGSRIVLGGGGVGDEAAYSARPGVSVPRCGGARLFVVGS